MCSRGCAVFPCVWSTEPLAAELQLAGFLLWMLAQEPFQVAEEPIRGQQPPLPLGHIPACCWEASVEFLGFSVIFSQKPSDN